MKSYWFIVPVLLFMHTVEAEDAPVVAQWQFYPSFGVGWNQINFVRPSGKLSANNKTVNIGLTATNRDYFVNYQSELFGKSNFQNGTEFTSVEREDQTLTVGKIFERVNVFVGYTETETKDDFLGEFHFDKGFFLGGGYDFPLGDSRLGISIGYANLDGQIFRDSVGLIESGKTQGLSYRVGISGPFRNDLAYKIFVRYRGYKFNSGGVVTDKKILSIGASIVF